MSPARLVNPYGAEREGDMDVRAIVRAYLEAHGFDGIWNSDIPCGCENDDLCPCDFDGGWDCEPGYKIPCTCGEGCDWHIGPRPSPESEDQP